MLGDIAISGVRILLIDDDPEFCSLLGAPQKTENKAR